MSSPSPNVDARDVEQVNSRSGEERGDGSRQDSCGTIPPLTLCRRQFALRMHSSHARLAFDSITNPSTSLLSTTLASSQSFK